jgi:hypothetical protein
MPYIKSTAIYKYIADVNHACTTYINQLLD